MKLIALLLTLLMMAACGAPSSSETQGTTQIPNPISVCASAQDFAGMGVSMKAPEGATDVGYSTISGQIAQIVFTLDGREYTFRGAVSDEDISGVYSEFEEEAVSAEASYADGDLSATIQTTKEGGRLARWTRGDASYTLFTSDAADDDTMISVWTKVSHE